jgi:hypothetical protein
VLTQRFVADPPGAGSDTLSAATQEALGLYAESLEGATRDADRVWFVMFREAREETAEAGNLARMRKQFRLAGEWKFDDLEVYLFERGVVAP